ncbi:MAG: nitrate reductase cytochrome c-type subunit [Deltaproteobacteria bacterium]|nr:nitrate reductase cytochrome c-type subunit [Deltaproteobacteria bacterium]
MQSRIWFRLSIATMLVALLAFGVSAEDIENAEVDDGVDVYFRDVDLSALASQELPIYLDEEPGESKLLDRAFPDAPPSIPHSVEDMLPIRRDSNECLECHHPMNVTEDDEIPVTESHFKNAQMVEGKPGEPMRLKVGSYAKGKDLSGARYDCTMCHVPQATNVKTPATSFTRVKTQKEE